MGAQLNKSLRPVMWSTAVGICCVSAVVVLQKAKRKESTQKPREELPQVSNNEDVTLVSSSADATKVGVSKIEARLDDAAPKQDSRKALAAPTSTTINTNSEDATVPEVQNSKQEVLPTIGKASPALGEQAVEQKLKGSKTMTAIERRVDPADGQQLTWKEFRQKYKLPIASPSPGWRLEHYWVEKCTICSDHSSFTCDRVAEVEGGPGEETPLKELKQSAAAALAEVDVINSKTMTVSERRVDPADGQQLTWKEFRQKYNLPVASPSPGWRLEHYWVEKCTICSDHSSFTTINTSSEDATVPEVQNSKQEVLPTIGKASPAPGEQAVEQKLKGKASPAPAEQAVEQKLNGLINQSPVMVFMKGSPETSKCDSSGKMSSILKKENISFGTFDILSDEDVRQGLKQYSNWPTYPQLYSNGKFIGGLEIVKELHEEGTLKQEICFDSKDYVNPKLGG